MDYYQEIKNKIINNEIYVRVKDYSKERNRVITYFEIGKLLYDAGGKYGEAIIEKYSKKLQAEVGEKYNKRALFRMRQFYMIFSRSEKVSQLATQLTWSHYVELLPLKDENKILYYIQECLRFNLTRNELREKIKNQEYERVSDAVRTNLICQDGIDIEQVIKNSIVIKNIKKYETISEKILQQLILEDIPAFLKELGVGFSFIGNEYKIKIGDRYNYIDLLLYNIKFKCYVVIELKVTELKKEHIGQIEAYMNYIDKNMKTIDEDKTVGIIIVKKENKYVMEYCSDDRIIAKEYKLV